MLKLTALEYDRPIWVNMNLFTSFEHWTGGTIIHFDKNNSVKVKETTDQLEKLWPLPMGDL